MPLPKTTLLRPRFDSKSIRDKVHNSVCVSEKYKISKIQEDDMGFAIAMDGVPARAAVDGIYVFAVKVNELKQSGISIGFTPRPTFDAAYEGFGAGTEIGGASIYLAMGLRCPDDAKYLTPAITKKAKEVVSILQISGNGERVCVQFVVDGHEGAVVDVSRHFAGRSFVSKTTTTTSVGSEIDGETLIFPFVLLAEVDQAVEVIAVNQVTFMSPLIEGLLRSNEASEKDEKIRQQAIQIAELQKLVAQKDAEIAALQKQVTELSSQK